MAISTWAPDRDASARAVAVLAPPPAELPAGAPTRRPRRRIPREPDEPPHRAGGGERGGDRDRDGGGGGGRGDGDPDPAGAPHGATDLAFGFLLVAVCTLFLAFLLAFALLRDGGTWPTGRLVHAPRGLWASTVLLVASELAMLRAGRSSSRRAAERWLERAALLGALFLAAQAWVWRDLLVAGRTAGSDAYAAVFYALTGLHAVHVLGGLAYMLVVRRRSQRGRSAAMRVRGFTACRVYWHLMGGLWLLVFALLYFGA